MICDVIDNVPDTGSLLICCDSWIILNLVVLQGHLNIKDRSKSVLLVVRDGNLLCKVGHA